MLRIFENDEYHDLKRNLQRSSGIGRYFSVILFITLFVTPEQNVHINGQIAILLQSLMLFFCLYQSVLKLLLVPRVLTSFIYFWKGCVP